MCLRLCRSQQDAKALLNACVSTLLCYKSAYSTTLQCANDVAKGKHVANTPHRSQLCTPCLPLHAVKALLLLTLTTSAAAAVRP
jgi:hypothetical protein